MLISVNTTKEVTRPHAVTLHPRGGSHTQSDIQGFNGAEAKLSRFVSQILLQLRYCSEQKQLHRL